MITAIVLADRLGTELAPLTDRTCVAMLPLAGRPLVQHAIERLADSGIEDIVVVSADAGAIERLLGDGTRFGVRIRCALGRGEEPPAALLARLGRGPGHRLVVRGDVLHDTDVAAFLEQARAVDASTVLGATGRGASVALVRDGAAGLDALGWPVPGPALDVDSLPDGVAQVTLAAVTLAPLESLAAYHRASLDALAGRFAALDLPGHEPAPGLRRRRGSRVDGASLERGTALVGIGARVDSRATLAGTVVIGDHALIDRGARVEDAVIMPHTYVGELLDVRNAIVTPDRLIRVDTGAVVEITDAFLLADLSRSPLVDAATDWLNRAAGLVLLLVSAPLFPLGLLAAFVESPLAPVHARRLVGNRRDPGDRHRRRTFRRWHFATRARLLAGLPGLLAVVAGDLRLVGCSPIGPERAAARRHAFERVRDDAPVGLVAPAQVALGPGASSEARLLEDALYARTRSPAGDLGIAVRALASLLTASAWRGA